MPTYQEYQSAGGTMSLSDYTAFSRKAWALLDTLTMGRAAVSTGAVLSKVKLALYDMADELFRQSQGGEVASATNDGYSETYVVTGKSREDKLRSIAASYLANTGLLYRGL